MSSRSSRNVAPKYFSTNSVAGTKLAIELPEEDKEATQALVPQRPSSTTSQSARSIRMIRSNSGTPRQFNGRTPRYREPVTGRMPREFSFRHTPRPPIQRRDSSSPSVVVHRRPIAAPKPGSFKRRNSRLTPRDSTRQNLVISPPTIQPISPVKPAHPELTTPKSGKINLTKLVTQVKPVQSDSEQRYKDHLWQTFQALKFVRNLRPVDTEQLNAKSKILQKKTNFSKLIIFDLDETLVHCCEDDQASDVRLPIVFPSGETVIAGLNIRPYVNDCLKEARKHFEVAVFTASHQCYADAVLNYLDPNHALIQHRLYRDSCVIVDGIYIKDLRIILNWDIKDIVIIDNAAYSFGYQLDNGIPIITWIDDKEDRELYNLIDYMKLLAGKADIQEQNRKVFKLYTFFQDY